MPKYKNSINFGKVPKPNPLYLEIIQLVCNFCGSNNVERKTLTCLDCNTVAPDQKFIRKKGPPKS